MKVTYVISGHINADTGCQSKKSERWSCVKINTIAHLHILREVVEEVTCAGYALAGIECKIIPDESVHLEMILEMLLGF